MSFFKKLFGSNKPTEAKTKMAKTRIQWTWICDVCSMSNTCACNEGKCIGWCPQCSGRVRWQSTNCIIP